ncbi:translation factor [Anaeramoeba flamelloides]|uniref:Translation factor n=1 Tax=Anaeramoeba flamelloides TaxID=1746091 RepID=A0ABQ8XXX2_9EUKA|nr:translation factor [Anaeramoeba flamelloides]
MTEKKFISLAMMGNVDSGKSTIAGNLLRQLKKVDNKTILRYEKISYEMGKSSFKYAWVFDQSKAERERGITINWTTRDFETDRFHFALMDTPGHHCFVKNAIRAISQADVAILVVDPTTQRFPRRYTDQEYNEEYIKISKSFGIEKMVVLVNKIDEKSFKYSESIFLKTKKEIRRILKEYGYNPKRVPFIPVSGWKGENLIEKTEQLGWWKGPTFLEALNNLKAPSRKTIIPLRFTIRKPERISGIGTVVVGKVETGQVRVGQKLYSPILEQQFVVNSIEKFHQKVQVGECGALVGLNLRNVPWRGLRKVFVLGDLYDDIPRKIIQFTAKITVLNTNPKRVKVGYNPIIHISTAHHLCRLEKIVAKIEKSTNEVLEQNPSFLKKNDSAIVIFKPLRPICAECFHQHPALGRILIQEHNIIVCAGIITDVQKMDFLLKN